MKHDLPHFADIRDGLDDYERCSPFKSIVVGFLLGGIFWTAVLAGWVVS